MFLKSTEVNIKLVKVLKESTERCALGHHSEGIDILREALTTIAELAIRTRDVGVGVVDVAREEHAGVYLAPVASHLLAILTAGVEVGYLVGSEDVVHVLGELGFEWSHDGELLAHEDAGEELLCSGKDHSLLLEVLDVGTLGEELRHVVYAMAGLLGEEVAGAREDGGAHEDGYVRKGGDELLHEGEVLCAIVLGRYVDLQEGDVDVCHRIVIALGRVANEKFTLWIVVFQPILQGSTYEAASDNSNVDHVDVNFIICL